MKRLLRSLFAAGWLCVVICAATAQAQSNPANTGPARLRIAVTVNGEDGSGIPAAAITVKGPKGTYTGTAGEDGKANIEVPFIPRAEYWVSGSKPGYLAKERLVVLERSVGSGTIEAPVIVLSKRGGVLVTFTVTKEGSTLRVREAHIKVRDSIYAISDDYFRTTNSEGVGLIQLPGPGTYPFTINQDTFEPYEGTIEVKAGEDRKSVDVALKEKQSEETITVTVLGDVRNGRGETEPIAEASVSGGGSKVVTDKRGTAILPVRPYAIEGGTAMGWAEAVDVTVSADGYKTQNKRVQLQQQRLGQTSSAVETFTLERGEDQASETAPIRIVVEVRDSIGPVPLAEVTLATLGGGETDRNGERAFESGNLSAEVLAKLRNGIAVKVTHAGHKVYDKIIPAELLRPSTEVRRYSVQLEEDWSGLTNALTSLEGRVAAWKNAAESIREKAKSIASISTKGADARRRGESLLGELKAARKEADAKRPESACKEAKELEESMLKWQADAVKKEEMLQWTLDKAIGLASNCKSKADAETIRANHKSALVLTAELGRLEKQAVEDNKRLARIIQSFPDPNSTALQLQHFVDKLEEAASGASKDAAAADAGFEDAVNAAKALPGRRAGLLQIYDQIRADHHVREYQEVLPRDLRKRLDSLEAMLSPTGNDGGLSFTPSLDDSRLKVIKETLTVLEEYKSQAVDIVHDYLLQTCHVKVLDYIVAEIGDTVTGATIELGAASDLPAKADACAAKGATTTPSASPVSDEITVPDVSGFNDPPAMKAAAGPDMVGVIVATKATPPPGTTTLFASQDPPAGSKAKRGSTLKIFIYQSLAEASPTPSPSASVAASPSPSASASATPSTGNMLNLIGLTLEQAVARLPKNMRIGSDEIGDKPPTPEQALTIFAQTPGAGTKYDPKNPPVVSVKRYGSSKTVTPPVISGDPFVGTWTGVSIYKSGAVDLTISKQGADYQILVQGNTSAYPAKSDGTRLSHQFGIYEIWYVRVGDTLQGSWKFTDLKGRVTTGQSVLRRK